MKIVLVGRITESPYLSGPEKFSRQLHKNILLKNINVVFIEYFFKKQTGSNIIKRFFGKCKISDVPEVHRLGHLSLLLYLLNKKPDIVHILTAERYTISVFLYKFLYRSKIVTTFHSVLRYEIPNNHRKKDDLNNYRDYLWEWLAVKLSDRMIFLSEQHLELALKYYKFMDKNKIMIIPHAVEIDFSNNNKKLDINDCLRIIFYNGNNDSIDRGLTEIFKILNQIDLPLRVYVIGDVTNIPAYNVSYEFVKIMSKDKLIRFLYDKHILLKSITYDSFSIFSIECMAAGLITITSNMVGSSSFINDGENGFVYDYKKPERVLEILRDIYYKKYDVGKISSNARKIINTLNWENITKRYLDCYKEFI